jgi:hypothetical protein
VLQYLAEPRESDSGKTSLLNQAAAHLRRDEAASNSVLLAPIKHGKTTSKSPSFLHTYQGSDFDGYTSKCNQLYWDVANSTQPSVQFSGFHWFACIVLVCAGLC